ncbi:MAG: ATP synthase subunit c [candidate division BRC1 bacterium ADurb.BinA364]|nr:MAG: ATP synthase subunit c [candidate division BRC1 bacterium ADurb.BinA364]
MESINILHLAYPLGLSIAVIGSGFGLGKAVSAAMEAMGRQPEAAGKIQTAMIIGCAFIEALTIYALISVFLVGTKGWKPAEEAAPAQHGKAVIQQMSETELAALQCGDFRL